MGHAGAGANRAGEPSLHFRVWDAGSLIFDGNVTISNASTMAANHATMVNSSRYLVVADDPEGDLPPYFLGTDLPLAERVACELGVACPEPTRRTR